MLVTLYYTARGGYSYVTASFDRSRDILGAMWSQSLSIFDLHNLPLLCDIV